MEISSPNPQGASYAIKRRPVPVSRRPAPQNSSLPSPISPVSPPLDLVSKASVLEFHTVDPVLNARRFSSGSPAKSDGQGVPSTVDPGLPSPPPSVNVSLMQNGRHHNRPDFFVPLPPALVSLPTPPPSASAHPHPYFPPPPPDTSRPAVASVSDATTTNWSVSPTHIQVQNESSPVQRSSSSHIKGPLQMPASETIKERQAPQSIHHLEQRVSPRAEAPVPSLPSSPRLSSDPYSSPRPLFSTVASHNSRRLSTWSKEATDRYWNKETARKAYKNSKEFLLKTNDVLGKVIDPLMPAIAAVHPDFATVYQAGQLVAQNSAAANGAAVPGQTTAAGGLNSLMPLVGALAQVAVNNTNNADGPGADASPFLAALSQSTGAVPSIGGLALGADANVAQIQSYIQQQADASTSSLLGILQGASSQGGGVDTTAQIQSYIQQQADASTSSLLGMLQGTSSQGGGVDTTSQIQSYIQQQANASTTSLLNTLAASQGASAQGGIGDTNAAVQSYIQQQSSASIASLLNNINGAQGNPTQNGILDALAAAHSGQGSSVQIMNSLLEQQQAADAAALANLAAYDTSQPVNVGAEAHTDPGSVPASHHDANHDASPNADQGGGPPEPTACELATEMLLGTWRWEDEAPLIDLGEAYVSEQKEFTFAADGQFTYTRITGPARGDRATGARDGVGGQFRLCESDEGVIHLAVLDDVTQEVEVQPIELSQMVLVVNEKTYYKSGESATPGNVSVDDLL
ncbi:hypothetical protein BKA67DRAFT_540409 [Truncatella angustata]|uniref:Uncharacterized protein n=1 Tax=Truncatella angustata TaxID=152316 RepID=A0A9P8UCP5_9PEZI|nr:uncharacterized protein BKA67DRAFT_540409 [Truncatella angustata]KAH6646941.1 hypothetical protein BKA67DRAFT_540409 [Truncatella angustata]